MEGADSDLFEDPGFSDWAPLLGKWERTPEGAVYLPPPEPEPAIGLLIGPEEFSGGRLDVTVRFPQDEAENEPQARIVFGHDPRREANPYYTAGLGGYGALYVIEAFVPGRGYVPLRTLGEPENLVRDRNYDIAVTVIGQAVALEVDGVEVVIADLPGPLPGSQAGLTAWGRARVEFQDFEARSVPPKAFVVMQFGEPYDALYQEVIRPVCEEMDFEPQRADDVYGPGVILADIIAGIRRATVVIAEITPVNANVFYELGYAHGMDIPAILLAERGQTLPFDIGGYRCIFYDDSIGGKRQVERDLRRHLEAIA